MDDDHRFCDRPRGVAFDQKARSGETGRTFKPFEQLSEAVETAADEYLTKEPEPCELPEPSEDPAVEAEKFPSDNIKM